MVHHQPNSIAVEAHELPARKKVAGRIVLPGSKSLSNRALLLAALARGTTNVQNLTFGEDVEVMLTALRELHIDWRHAGDDVIVVGCNGSFPQKAAELHLGNAGTAYRPLTAALALSQGRYRLWGLPRMYERPIGGLVTALHTMGADVRYLGTSGYPPLEIHPHAATPPTQVEVDSAQSSQFLSALLMAAPLTGQTVHLQLTTPLISEPYVTMTMAMMQRFGVVVQRQSAQHFMVPAGHYRSPDSFVVEGDASAASYFLAAGAIAGGPVRVEGVGQGSLQGDTAFAHHLEKIGATVTWGDRWIETAAPPSGRKLAAFDEDLNDIPDAAMTLAVVALFCDGPCILRNIGSWRVKETDRLNALQTELRKTNAVVTVGPDWLRVEPPVAMPKTPITFDTYQDHRMAMCLSLVSLAGVQVVINDPKCVDKTYPGYFADFAGIVRA